MQVSGLGQISNVGLSVESTCAAQRAGVSRIASIPGVTAYDPDALEAEIAGAPVRGLTDGFFYNARWVLLALESLRDLARNLDVSLEDSGYWRSTSIVWVLPELEFERFRIPGEKAEEFLRLACADVLLALSRLPISPRDVHFIAAGPRGLVLACAKAQEMLRAGASQRVILLATDSWLDPMSLLWLQEGGRLKAPEHPTGLCPGESGACAVLRTTPEPRGPASAARILSWSSSDSSSSPPPESGDLTAWRSEAAAAFGRALAEAIERALVEARSKAPFRGSLILDLNGEIWRAMAWGHAQVRLQRLIDFSASKVVLPAISFGDIGAAAPAAGLCIAARSFARSYAAGSQAIVASVSDRGAVGALVIGAPDR